MAFLDNVFGKVFAGRKGLRGNRQGPSQKRDRRLGMEQVESRMMMSASMTGSVASHDLPDFSAPALLAGSNQLTETGLAPASAAAASHRVGSSRLVAPAAPSFTAMAVSTSQINLSWRSVSGANGYLVDEWVNGAWKQIGSVGSGCIGGSVTGLSAGTTYYFDVAAYNAMGTSWANAESATTNGAATTKVNEPAAATAYSAVSGSLFGANGPTYLDVRQGEVGDCWLLSSLAEVATRDPADIRNMFTTDGTTVVNGATVSLYNVRFYNKAGVAEYVTVDTELPSGGAYYDQPQNGVLWVALAEKAYAEANGAGFVTTSSLGSGSYAALNDGDPSWALQAITGKSASDFAINPTNIAAAWNAGELVVLATGSAGQLLHRERPLLRRSQLHRVQ